MPESDSPLRCVIIDDNEINRLTLEHFVEMTDTLALTASLPDGVQGLSFLRESPAVDILLLDIEMPHLSGLDLVRLLPQPQPEVILVTTHRDFAVEAFSLRITDYLVKPVDYARFTQAIDRARESRRAALAPAAPAAELTVGNELFVKVNNRMVRLDFDEVLYIEALSTYSVLVTSTQKHIVYLTLKALTERLPFAHFVRVHRSYIVNTRRIDAIEDNMLQLGQYEVPVGRSYQDEFFQKLRNL
ncbi:LytTR family DNA-binding domain-containing protein [Hymenobacter sp. BT175]|uniref:LytR/AlgR family response regulator transcription factor n=1 Tax=Hymenobacter translucens TaxID=2886507 RepID=UPI001D0E26A6|nr:LytTR family DNA-binding domain-containing protein [Hymenobacter translucens]MCC2545575.1 LytTR family DNA-binding domain-containing protein [Hymenobacter translucens]